MSVCASVCVCVCMTLYVCVCQCVCLCAYLRSWKVYFNHLARIFVTLFSSHSRSTPLFCIIAADSVLCFFNSLLQINILEDSVGSLVNLSSATQEELLNYIGMEAASKVHKFFKKQE